MTDLNWESRSKMPTTDASGASKLDHWKNVVVELSSEIAAPLSSALERVQQLMDSGRIDRASLRALNGELQRAKQLSIAGQQLGHLASGQMPQIRESIHLNEAIQEALKRRSNDIESRGIRIELSLQPIEISADLTLLFNLIDMLLTWSLQNAQSSIEFKLDVRSWPTNARLACKFGHCSTGQSEENSAHAAKNFNTVTWRLIEQTTWAMDALIERKIGDDQVLVIFEMPRKVEDQIAGMGMLELDQGQLPTGGSKPLAGSQVLVVASRRDVRIQVRDALRNMGLVVDFVNSIDEAREFCKGGLPHAVVMESVLRGAHFNQFRSEIDSSNSKVAFIEILEEGNSFEISGFGGLNMARVGRDAILTTLPSALTFELSKA